MNGQRIDLGPRRSGKTTRAIAWLVADATRHLVVLHESEKSRLLGEIEFRQTAECTRGGVRKKYERRILTFADLLGPGADGLRGEVWIDNADYLLEMLVQQRTACRLEGFSMSLEGRE